MSFSHNACRIQILGSCSSYPVLQASPIPFRSADRFQYRHMESDWRCGTEWGWLARLVHTTFLHLVLFVVVVDNTSYHLQNNLNHNNFIAGCLTGMVLRRLNIQVCRL